ncbi:hypothetical protein D7V97_27785 [Corallococcus sp. CA053C]|nr:hypothetical protein D7V97_27785 [Corallococcus sp. CA053C]
MLLTACIGTVATEQATSDDVSSNELVGAPLRITTTAPRATRRVVVRASSTKPPDKSVEGELRVRLTARWIPDDPAQTTTPWIQLHVSNLEVPSAGAQAPAVLEVGAPITRETEAFLQQGCKLDTGCEWPFDVGFELQSDAVAGTVELEWTAQATARVVDTSSVPKGFTVSVSAP